MGRIIHEKLKVAGLFKNVDALVELEVTSPCSQKLSTANFKLHFNIMPLFALRIFNYSSFRCSNQ
jgi:hypothetical protein